VNPESGDPVTGRGALLIVHIPETLLKGEVEIALDTVEPYW
jgi:hypothetical protein